MTKLLTKIQVLYVQDLIIFFLKKYIDGEIKTLDSVIHNVKTFSNCIMDINYIFDLNIWHPSMEDDYKDLIRFDFKIFDKYERYSILLKLSDIDSRIDEINKRNDLI